MQTNDLRIPTHEEIKSIILEELRYHRKYYRFLDIEEHVATEELYFVAGAGTQVDTDPKLSDELRRRLADAVHEMECDGLLVHEELDCCYITDEGMQHR
jgi:hypothetical protein